MFGDTGRVILRYEDVASSIFGSVRSNGLNYVRRPCLLRYVRFGCVGIVRGRAGKVTLRRSTYLVENTWTICWLFVMFVTVICLYSVYSSFPSAVFWARRLWESFPRRLRPAWWCDTLLRSVCRRRNDVISLCGSGFRAISSVG